MQFGILVKYLRCVYRRHMRLPPGEMIFLSDRTLDYGAECAEALEHGYTSRGLPHPHASAKTSVGGKRDGCKGLFAVQKSLSLPIYQNCSFGIDPGWDLVTNEVKVGIKFNNYVKDRNRVWFMENKDDTYLDIKWDIGLLVLPGPTPNHVEIYAGITAKNFHRYAVPVYLEKHKHWVWQVESNLLDMVPYVDIKAEFLTASCLTAV